MSTKITTPANDTRSDEETLKEFLTFLENGIEITTGFIPDEDTGFLTHQVIRITCGEYITVSQPEPLAFPLQPAPIAETGITIN